MPYNPKIGYAEYRLKSAWWCVMPVPLPHQVHLGHAVVINDQAQVVCPEKWDPLLDNLRHPITGEVRPPDLGMRGFRYHLKSVLVVSFSVGPQTQPPPGK